MKKVPDKTDINYLQRKVISTGQQLYVSYPWRETSNIWHALVAEVMLQRTRVDQVLPVYIDFTARFPNPEGFIEHVAKTDENIFSLLGLTWRHELLINASKFIIESCPPDSFKLLMLMPGVGEYVAAAVASFHLGERAILIDSNIVRFYCRYFGFEYDNETRRKKWFRELADKLTPEKVFRKYNYAVLDFSMKVCKIKPECHLCPFTRRCRYYNEKSN